MTRIIDSTTNCIKCNTEFSDSRAEFVTWCDACEDTAVPSSDNDRYCAQCGYRISPEHDNDYKLYWIHNHNAKAACHD